MIIPKSLAIIKCVAHCKDNSWITKGNKAADVATKNAASAECCTIMVNQMIDLEERLTHKDSLLMREEALELERKLCVLKRASRYVHGL